MTKEASIKLFEEKKVRSVWDEEREEWYLSVVDVVGVLSESANPRRYWSDLKIKLKKEGSQLYENFVQLKMQSEDGKSYLTDVATIEQVFRLIQSIPSPKAEPFSPYRAEKFRKYNCATGVAQFAKTAQHHLHGYNHLITNTND